MRAALVAVPAATLAASYAWLAVDHGTPWLAPVVVHESGRYTFAETVLYWRHFLRELPVSALYAGATVAAAAAYGPRGTRSPSFAARAAALAAAAALVAVAWLQTGTPLAWAELLQSYLRDDEPPRAGTHWGYHLLSSLTYVAGAVVLAALPGGRARAPRALATVVVAAIAVTLLARPGAAPFADARHLGHQAREAVTHALVTLPASFAVLAFACGWRAPWRPAWSRHVAVAAAAGVVTAAYVSIGFVGTGAADTARPGAPASSLVAAHFWEHALDYVLVMLLTVALAPRVDGGGGG